MRVGLWTNGCGMCVGLGCREQEGYGTRRSVRVTTTTTTVPSTMNMPFKFNGYQAVQPTSGSSHSSHTWHTTRYIIAENVDTNMIGKPCQVKTCIGGAMGRGNNVGVSGEHVRANKFDWVRVRVRTSVCVCVVLVLCKLRRMVSCEK